MTINSADFARIYGDPDDDYDSFEKAVVRSIDALDQLAFFLDEFVFDMDHDLCESTPEFRKELRSQKAVVISLCNALREWGLGIPDHVVQK
jgi:hypothetical protein